MSDNCTVLAEAWPAAQRCSSGPGTYAAFAGVFGIFAVGIVCSKAGARALAKRLRIPLRHTTTYKSATRWSAPVIGLPLVFAALEGAPVARGSHWWLGGSVLLCLSMAFHHELVRGGPALKIVQLFDKLFCAYNFAYHTWLAVVVGSSLGLFCLGLVVACYWVAWVEAHAHTCVHVCGALAGLAIITAQTQLGCSASHIPFILA